MDDVLGTLVSYELAHNFIVGNGHTSDEEFAINEPSAFDLRNFTDVSSPRSLMHPIYSNTENGTGFVLVNQWQTIRRVILSTSSSGTG